MTSNKPVDKLADNLKGLVIGASGTIPGYQHGEIKRMVEKCGAKFASMNISECTHLVTTEENAKKKLKKINRARELKGCEIVNIDWLLKKIKKHIPEVDQKEILKREGNEGVRPKDKKRERDSSEDNEGNLSKKTKDEEQINLKRLIDLVDDKYPKSSDTVSVYQDDAGLIWDATLVNADGEEQVDVLRIQLLQVHGKSQLFHTWDLQYRFGSSEESDPGKIDMIPPRSKGWFFLEMHHREAPIFTSEISPLPASVENVLKIIFTSGNLKNYVQFLTRYGRSVLLGTTVDKKKLLVGIAVLDKLMELTNPQVALGGHSNVKNRLCKIYESLILTNMSISAANDTIRQELESLDLLLKLHDASKILEKKLPVILIGHEPNFPMKGKSTEFKMLQEYIEKSSSPNHPSQFKASHEVMGIFRLELPGEAERFSQWEKENLSSIGDRRLLWHGSMSSNFAGILSQGLRGDGIVSTDGKNFVPGVFFADISTKSAGYCRQKGEALMLLCEVELGKASAVSDRHGGRTFHKRWRDAGYIHPDFKGTQVPDVDAGTATLNNYSGLYHSEYVAKSPAQIRQRYLFHVKIV
ncbi:uncharacterized protein N7487_000414 [Penicillium crustosum]|uniref:uncharacterized protein n=1 Tax=Penicillium crustosum TaxID=36656 RepID=UPI00238CABAD|nr:uncharacterized protein N7487_000414 [Penicillium crustosum]KAJ5416864.1 hypothetical protein N7487_000414 [Penicillium crustosum]